MDARRATRTARGPLCGLMVLLLALTFASTASAAILQSPALAAVGDPVTFTEDATADCMQTYTWTVDGVAQAPQTGTNGRSITQTFSQPGSHTVSVHVTTTPSTCGAPVTDTDTFPVSAALAGSFSVSPDPPLVNQPAMLSATQTGGTQPYKYTWSTDNNGSFDNASSRTPNVTFTTTGPHVVRVKIDDYAGHETIVSRTLDVQSPPTSTTTSTSTSTSTQTSTSTTTTPPPCKSLLTFGLSEFTTTGCFQLVATSPSNTWTTTSAVKLNGIPFPDYGQTFTITEPNAQYPGGHFTAPNSAIQLDNFVVFSGDVDWTLPAGNQKDEKDLKTFKVIAGSQLFGLNVRGSVALRLGWDANGKHYATFGLNVELPAGFRATPEGNFGSVTGSTSLRVDDLGFHYDGLRLEAKDVWIGKIRVEQACFSFVPAGGQTVAACPAPTLDGTAYITCASNVNTNRWDGNAVIDLPGSGIQLAAFGGLADGQISHLGGFIDNLGRKVPLAPNVYLDRLGLGLCLTPPPLKLRGDVGVAIFPTTGDQALAKIDGHVTYTDGYPWKLEIGGTVKADDLAIGTGSVTLTEWGSFGFDLGADVNLYGVASLGGQISGWVDPPSNQYAVSGSVYAQLGDLPKVEGSAVISNLGVAGCVTIASEGTDYGTLAIGLGDPPTIGFAKSELYFTAGVGYRWGASWPDLFGGSCDLSSYAPTRPFARDARAGVISERVAPGTIALSWRIHGTHGVPKVVIHGPHGTTIASPTRGMAAQRKGHWLLVENRPNGTTNLLLIHPPAGRWTVSGVAGAPSAPTTIDQAKSEAPPTVAARVRGTGPVRTLQMAYAVPRGASLRVVERGAGIERTIARSVHGHRCPGRGPGTRPGTDEAILCFNLRFRPARGPGGVRKIQVVVTRGGLPLMQKDIASFRVPRLRLPSRPRYLLARRTGGNLQVAFTPSAGASRYVASVSLSDGRELAYDVGPSCQALLIKGVPSRIAAKIKLAGMRFDLVVGASQSVSIKAGARSAGPRGKLPARLRRPRKTCS